MTPNDDVRGVGHQKVSCVCIHLMQPPRKEVVLFDSSVPLDERDTGKTFLCTRCADNPPQTKEEYAARMTLMCEGCMEENTLHVH